ncbi:hypothetical protein SUGI_0363170 [Cryptomeria japonica]|nr:hypothetical protein SUGI_0363170 [Cryptomeria japonica]
MEVPLLERKTSNDGRLLNSWLKEVRDSLGRESIFQGKEVIYPVPLCLKKDETKLFYHPKEFCFGPQHFRAKALGYKYGEEIKAEVVRKFNGLLTKGLFSVVAKFKEQTMQERIVKSYAILDRSLINNNEVISWLLVRDACFVIEVLYRFSVEEPNL